MSVLVTGGSRRASLAVVRSLGRQGLPVIVGDFLPGGPASLSRYAKENMRYPSPQAEPSRYVESLLTRIRRGDIEAVFPIHDFEILPVLERREEFESFTRLPFPDLETFRIAWDKKRTLELAARVGLRVPRSVEVDTEHLRQSARDLPYPVVIKPQSQTLTGTRGVRTSYVTSRNYATTPEEFIRGFLSIRVETPQLLIQEYVQGYGAGVGMLCNHGQPRAAFAYRRIREYPVTGGPSTLRESVQDSALVSAATHLLRAMKWHGVAMVEFKVPAEGDPVLMEVNGRFWGSLALALAAGVDFPFLLYRMAVIGDVEPVMSYRLGVRCRWILPGDLLHLWTTRGTRGANLGSFFDLRHTHFDHLTRDDPLPVAGAVVTSFRQFLDYLRGTRSLSGEYRASTR